MYVSQEFSFIDTNELLNLFRKHAMSFDGIENSFWNYARRNLILLLVQERIK